MTLAIGNYTRALSKERSGVKASFKLSGPVTIGGIYQNVDMIYTLDGKKQKYTYSELWVISKKNKKRRIELAGVDSFLIDHDHVDKHDGSLVLRLVAWFEAGPYDAAKFQRTEHGHALWGVLRGSDRKRRVPRGASTLKRHIRVTWKRGQKPKWVY